MRKTDEDLRTRVARSMREAYNAHLDRQEGAREGLVPFHKADSREAWLVCADEAIRILHEQFQP